MKRLSSFLVAASIVFSVTALQAFNSPIPKTSILFKTESVSASTLDVRLANLQQSKTSLVLVDMAGREYFREVVTKHNGFAKTLNLEELSDGLYKLVVKNSSEELSLVVKKDGPSILLSKVHQ